MKKKRWIIVLISIAVSIIVVSLIVVLSIPKDQIDNTTDEYEMTPIDADEYYKENSTIISKESAEKSDKVTTESETNEMLTQRGFSDCEIITNYSMNGEYSDDTEINSQSSESHPMYCAYYAASNEDIWTIEVINGIVTAYPASYYIEHPDEVPIIVSESDTIYGYDGITNQFYEIIPNDSVMRIKKVDKITAGVLDSLSEEGVER